VLCLQVHTELSLLFSYICFTLLYTSHCSLGLCERDSQYAHGHRTMGKHTKALARPAIQW
jgi:hypothetical protein